MKKFQFKYRALEHVRKIAEDRAIKHFSQAQAAFRAEINKKSKLISDLEQALVRREKELSPSGLKLEDVFIEGTRLRIQHQDQIILKARKKLEKAFVVFRDARRKAKTLEKIKTREMAEHKKNNLKSEYRDLDEWVLLRKAAKTTSQAVLLVGLLFCNFTYASNFGNDNCIVDEGVVTEIRAERERLKAKESELEKLQAELESREKALNEQLAKLDELQKDVTLAKDKNKKLDEESLSKLVETFERMSPVASAKMMASLDENLAVSAMSRMNTATLAKVMAKMDPQKANRLSEIMTLGKEKGGSK